MLQNLIAMYYQLHQTMPENKIWQIFSLTDFKGM